MAWFRPFASCDGTQRPIPLRMRVPRPLILSAVAVLAVGVGCLAFAVQAGTSLVRFDTLASSTAYANAVGPVLDASFAVTVLGGTEVVPWLLAAGAAVLLAARLWRSAAALALAVGLTQIVVQLVKEAVSRPRPPANEAIADAGGFSFPSGHAATSAALFGVLALVAIHNLRGPARVCAACAGLVVIAGVGLSRVLLGAHYPTDVVAGWMTGAAVAVASVALLAWPRRPASARTAAQLP